MPETKAELRRRLRRARTDRAEHERADVAAALARHAAELTGATIAAFVGVRSEPPTVPLLEALARARRARAAAGAARRHGSRLGARSPAPPSSAEGRLRMLEPVGPPLGPGAIAAADLVLVPALAVDGTGMRLGQGGGSYDRALARASAPVVAVVFGDEVLEYAAGRGSRPIGGRRPDAGSRTSLAAGISGRWHALNISLR